MVPMAVSNICIARFWDGLVEKEYQDILLYQSNPRTPSLIPAAGGWGALYPLSMKLLVESQKFTPDSSTSPPCPSLRKVTANSSHPCSLSLQELSVPGCEEGMDMLVGAAA